MISTGIRNGVHSIHSDKIGQMRLPALYQCAGCGVYNAPLMIAAKIKDAATAPRIAASPIGIYRQRQHSAPTHTLAISISAQ